MHRGTCKLCLKDKELQESHYIPAALYPRKVDLEYGGPGGEWIAVQEEITAPLLCFECEQRFSAMGESEVLGQIASKIAKKAFPLHERLLSEQPREEYPDVRLYNGVDVKLDTDKFAYFMLSLVWRGAVHSWQKQDGSFTRQLQLGQFTEPIRQFLLGEAPFPSDTAVIVIVCTDTVSRRTWFLPTEFWELDCFNVRFHALGVHFRAIMGRNLPIFFRRACCRSAGKWIVMGDCETRTMQALGER